MNGNDINGQPKSDLAGKTVLLVNTNSANDPLHSKKFFIKKVKNLGVKIILLGKEAATFQPLVDFVIVADTTNYMASLSALEAFLQANPDIKLDGVGTFLEDDVLLTAKIADKYRLIGPSHKVANLARNKYLFRNFCKKNNLPTIKHKELKNGRDLEEVINNFSFPLVVKPAYGAGSAFVVRVNNEEELRESYDYIKKQLSPKIESALNDGLAVFVEEYIDGDEVDLDILIKN
jgi:biotin carboxylase